MPSEGFRIRSIGRDIHIVGRDTPKIGAHQVAARLGLEPGTLFGTYEFLERYYGMLFAWHYDQTPLYMIAPVTEHIIDKCRAQQDHGVDGGYHYIARSYELLGAGHYLLARMMSINSTPKQRNGVTTRRCMEPRPAMEKPR